MSVFLDESGEREPLLRHPSTPSNPLVYASVRESSNNGNKIVPIPPSATTEKYWYRWYICAIFAMSGLLQGSIWNTWSPIDKSAGCALGFTSSDVTLLTNWGPILFLIMMPIVMWMLDKFGLRLPNVLSALAIALGTGLRCLPLPVHVLKYFIHIGQILNGAAGCAIMASPPLLSNVWFPSEERVTATSVATLFNYFGTGFAYILGPLMVRQPWNNSSPNESVISEVSSAEFCNSTEEKHIILNDIRNLMYFEFGLSVFVFLSMLIFFPNHPPKPPSNSASIARMDFWGGLKALRNQRGFIVITVTFAMTLGGYSGWTGVFSVMLNEVSVSQDEAGKLGFIMTLVGCGVGMLVGWFADRFKGRVKMIIISLFGLAFVAYLYYINMTQGWIEIAGLKFSHVGLWITCIIIGIAMNAAVPLGMEMGADAAYPTSEAVSASVIVWFFNLLSFIFLLVLQFSDADVTNYLMLGFIGVSIPLLIFFSHEPSSRIRIDRNNSAAGASVKNDIDGNINIADYDPPLQSDA